MSESFKINIYFDEKGESLESLIEHLIINMLDINEPTLQYMKRNIWYISKYYKGLIKSKIFITWAFEFTSKLDIIKMNSNYYLEHGKEGKCLSR